MSIATKRGAAPENVLHQVSYIKTGPTRRGYVVAGALWVVGLLVVFATSYSMELTLNERANDYETAAKNTTTAVQITEPGTHTLWVEEAIQIPVPAFSPSTQHRSGAPKSGRRLARIAVTDAAGAPVEITEQGAHDYRANRAGRTVNGIVWGSFEAGPGNYQVAVLSPEPSVLDVAVGPTPSPASIVPGVLGGLAISLLGLLVLLVVFVRRRRTGRELAVPRIG